MTNLLLSLLTAVARRTKASFVKKLARPKPCKSSSCDLLLAHQDTELGQKYGLSEIKTIDQFRDRSHPALQQL